MVAINHSLQCNVAYLYQRGARRYLTGNIVRVPAGIARSLISPAICARIFTKIPARAKPARTFWGRSAPNAGTFPNSGRCHREALSSKALDSLDVLKDQLAAGLNAPENNRERVKFITGWEWRIDAVSFDH